MELRGSTFHPPTLDMLDEFGVVPQHDRSGLKAPTWQFRDRETGPVATFDLSLLAGDTNHPYRVQCEQWKLMRLLRDAYLKDSRRRDQRAHTVTAAQTSDDAVAVTADTPEAPSRSRPLCGRLRRRPQRGAPLARRRVRRLHLSGAFLIASTDFRFEER